MSYGRNDFWDRERECERSFAENGPIYFITTEDLDWMLYENTEQFIVGTNLISIASARSGFTLLDDIQMNNHHHVLGKGDYVTASNFVALLHASMRRYQASLGRPSLKEWDVQIKRTEDLKQFRNQVAYSDRNAYVARLDSIPTGYCWGSAQLFFNRNLWLRNEGTPYSQVGGREKRIICRSHDVDLPSHFRVYKGMILRSSFVDYHTTEKMFNSANQYFTMLTRRGEADIEMANLLGERIQLPHEEVYQIVSGWYPGQRLTKLDYDMKLKAAMQMKQKLRCSNRQIIQILNLPAADVDKMFPIPV